MKKEDKEFLELCGDMGFWFDNVVGNEELLQRYYDLTQQREEEFKNLESDHEILIDEMQKVQEDMSKMIKKESDARKRFAEVVKKIHTAISNYKENAMFALDDKSDKKMLELIKGDYEEMIDLRHKTQYETEDESFSEDDTNTCDHCLDDMELLLALLDIVLQKGEKE